MRNDAIYKRLYLPQNLKKAYVLLRDIDLQLQVNNSKFCCLENGESYRKKSVMMTLVEVNIRHRIAPLRMLSSLTLTNNNLKIRNLKFQGMVRSSLKTRVMTFYDVDI